MNFRIQQRQNPNIAVQSKTDQPFSPERKADRTPDLLGGHGSDRRLHFIFPNPTAFPPRSVPNGNGQGLPTLSDTILWYNFRFLIVVQNAKRLELRNRNHFSLKADISLLSDSLWPIPRALYPFRGQRKQIKSNMSTIISWNKRIINKTPLQKSSFDWLV